MRLKHYYIFGYKKKDDKFEFCFAVKIFNSFGMLKETLFSKSLPMDNTEQLKRRIFDGWIISRMELNRIKPWAKLYNYMG